jgi:hypothetical protein
VYSLGVILFELLAHRLPYHLDQLPVHEVARVIQHDEPSRLGSIDTQYRGDVEIIVAKALEKEKSRRYASAGDLASDIRRYLRGEAIRARPASALYQLRKFVQRHKALVGGVLGIFGALLAGTIISILFAWRAAENARVATERERAATYESYRARIAAAVGALARHDVADAARQLDAAPEALRGWEWRHLRTRLDDSTNVLTARAGEKQFLIRDSNGIRVAALSRAGLRLTDLEGNELLARSFPPEAGLWYSPPLLTRHGLRLLATGGVLSAPTLNFARDPHATKIVNLLDDRGRVQFQLKGPSGRHALRGYPVTRNSRKLFPE